MDARRDQPRNGGGMSLSIATLRARGVLRDDWVDPVPRIVTCKSFSEIRPWQWWIECENGTLTRGGNEWTSEAAQVAGEKFLQNIKGAV